MELATRESPNRYQARERCGMKIPDERKLNSDLAWERLVQAGEDWADKDAAATLLEETKKSVLAEIKAKAGAKSDAAAETIALCDKGYKEHIKSMVEARRVANRAKVRYDSAKTLAELRRSEEATRRAEANIR